MSEATRTATTEPLGGRPCVSQLEPFQVGLLETKGPPVLALSGVLGPDAAMAIRTRAQQLLAVNQDVRLDLSGVQHLSAASLQVLLAVSLDLSRRGRALQVCASNDTVRQLFEVAGVADRFPFGEHKE